MMKTTRIRPIIIFGISCVMLSLLISCKKQPVNSNKQPKTAVRELFACSPSLNRVSVINLSIENQDIVSRHIESKHFDKPMSIAVDKDHNEIIVVSQGNNSVAIFNIDADGTVDPVRLIAGDKTALNKPVGVAYNSKRQEIIVTNQGDNSITVYSRNNLGNATPLRIIKGNLTEISNPGAVVLDGEGKTMFIANHLMIEPNINETMFITVFPIDANGDMKPTLSFATFTKEDYPTFDSPGVAFDLKRNELYVTCLVNEGDFPDGGSGQRYVAVFSTTGQRLRAFSLPSVGWGIAVDPELDEFAVTMNWSQIRLYKTTDTTNKLEVKRVIPFQKNIHIIGIAQELQASQLGLAGVAGISITYR